MNTFDYPKSKCIKNWGICDDKAYFLYNFTKNIKPKVIIETGTFEAQATYIMAKACNEINCQCTIYTIDNNQNLFENIMKKDWKKLDEIRNNNLNLIKDKFTNVKVIFSKEDSRIALKNLFNKNNIDKVDFFYQDSNDFHEIIKNEWDLIKKFLKKDSYAIINNLKSKGVLKFRDWIKNNNNNKIYSLNSKNVGNGIFILKKISNKPEIINNSINNGDNKSKRIALALYGEIRSFFSISNLILDNFKINEDYSLDIFIVTSYESQKKKTFKFTGEIIKHDFLEIKEKFKKELGDNLKKIHFVEDLENSKLKKMSISELRSEKILKLLESISIYEYKNDFIYDKIVLHRMDIIFCSWKTCDNYMPIDWGRERGLLYNGFDFPIGVKMHGGNIANEIPEKVDAFIDLNVDLKNDEIICYEDFWIGHTTIDFCIFNSNLKNDFILFLLNILNGDLYKAKVRDFKVGIHSYEAFNIDWWNAKNAVEDSHLIHHQIKLFLLDKNIKTKELRFTQDIGALYIRKY